MGRPESAFDDTPPKEPKGFWREFFALGGGGWILVAAVLAVVIGVIVNHFTDEIPPEAYKLVKLPGSLWIRALKAVVLPLIVSSLVVSMIRLRGMPGAGGKVMGLTLGYYIVTTFFAVVLGLIMANVMLIPNITQIEDPGALADAGDQEKAEDVAETGSDRSVSDQIVTIFENFIPDNVVNAMAENQLLSVIVTAVVVGALIPSGKTFIAELASEVEEVASKIVWFIIMIAPIGVFFLLLPEVMRLDLGQLAIYVGILVGTQAATMGLHWAVVYPSLYLLVVRANPFKFLSKIFPAVITALATSSSAATYPVTMRCSNAAGIPEEVSRFSLPLGMTINMDGSAIGFPLFTFWMAYSQGLTLSFGDMVLIAVTATLASIGTAPIPSASLVLLVMIANQVNVPTEGVFSLIVAIDWIIDRMRTGVNVSGDLYGAAILSKFVNVEEMRRIARQIDAVSMTESPSVAGMSQDRMSRESVEDKA